MGGVDIFSVQVFIKKSFKTFFLQLDTLSERWQQKFVISTQNSTKCVLKCSHFVSSYAKLTLLMRQVTFNAIYTQSVAAKKR